MKLIINNNTEERLTDKYDIIRACNRSVTSI